MLLQQIEQWFSQYFLSPPSIVQIIIVIVILVLCHIAAGRTTKHLANKLLKFDGNGFKARTSLSYREIFFLIFSLVFIWITVLIAINATLPVHILKTSASLVTAWAVIRISSSLIKSAFWSKLIAITMLIFVVLSTSELLKPTIKLLDEANILLGDYRLSLLILIKGFFALLIFVWLANVFSKLLDKYLYRTSDLTSSQKVLFSKLSKITLITLALLFTLSAMGVDLMALTVFSGALGLGIGIGLQKVFSNLISGIILLVDKSVKPGDVIAIGDTYGWINKLGGRCVSLITRDGKEHLLPNENMIIEKVENWSYSDDKIRIHVPVGVSYHSDIKLARKLMLEAVNSQERILESPQPVCLLMGFGDSSVDFEIRAWIADPINGISNVKSGIYETIWDNFKANAIEIPFPQRDVHIRNDNKDGD